MTRFINPLSIDDRVDAANDRARRADFRRRLDSAIDALDPTAHATAGSREWSALLDREGARAASRVVATSAEEFVARNRHTLLAAGASEAQIEAGLRDGSIERFLRAAGGLL